MDLNTLIKTLNEIKEEKGNIEVFLEDLDDSICAIGDVSFKTKEELFEDPDDEMPDGLLLISPFFLEEE
jgi:hypothetical protein